MSANNSVTGFAEMDRNLAELTQATGKGVLRRALKKAAMPLVELANSFAPEGDTGEYAQSFTYSTRLNKRQGKLHRRMFRDDRASVEGFVGTNDPAGVQQEFGNVNHGPQPALRPAWDQDHKEMLARLSQDLGAELQKSLQRAQRKAARG